MLRFLEILVVAIFVAAAFNQVVFPLWKGMPLFLAFRPKRRALLRELAEVKAQNEEKRLAAAVDREKSAI